MAWVEADRNLLFGILALQGNLIERRDLVAGFEDWVREKTRSLGDVLQSRGALTPQRRELIDALVAEHLRQHDGDPARSLATLSTLGSAREDLERIGDRQLVASLANLARPSPRVGEQDPFATRAPDGGEVQDDPFATQIGAGGESGDEGGRALGSLTSRFRVVRMHARGGLGVVSVAIDSELERAVALKEIQDRHADEPRSRSRFLMEAEITGKLEHPGIIPVYGLGSYADGRPYYAMRFVRGDSLREAIERYHAPGRPSRDEGQRRVELGELLGRFVDVCNAIAYAHSRGVLHRDIKPGNVMLGPYGETLVVDWGLAKPLENGHAPPEPELLAERASGVEGTGEASGSLSGRVRLTLSGGSAEETLPGVAIGTPAYMSPEQAAGRIEELGPSSDVYSLGATLYCLLTGRAPFDGRDLNELLEKVRQGTFPPPRQIDPAIPKPLEAVCLKAMALQPADRFEDARELAREIERWRADEPVRAYCEPWTVRLGRWIRRHKTLVASATVGTFAVLLGLAALWHQGQLQRAREGERAEVLVEAIEKSEDIRVVPELVREIGKYPSWIDERLKILRERSEPGTPAHRNATLSLLPREPGLGVEARELVLDEKADPQALAALGPALGDFGPGLEDELWKVLDRPPNPEDLGRWLRAAKTLRQKPASDEDPRWVGVGRALVDRLKAGGDASARRSLVLALGMLPTKVADEPKKALGRILLDAYRDDPDPGLHSAIGWLLRQRWDRADAVNTIDDQHAGQPPTPGRGWYLDGQGRTYTIIPKGTVFRMGTPAENLPEALRDEVARYEPPHRRAIPRRVAIATTEVTHQQFQQFLDAHPEVLHYGQDQPIYAPDDTAPAISVTWYEAVMFCRWLSSREGIAEEQMCYPPIDRIRPGFGAGNPGLEAELPDDFLERTGYRLPTEGEWECATRAGLDTLRPSGDGEALLDELAWWAGNAADPARQRPYPHAHAVAQLWPNAWGLFDVLGNANEWCHDAYRAYPENDPAAPPFTDGLESQLRPEDLTRIVRGHSFGMPHADYLRSGQRDHLHPLSVNSTMGFRVARTLPDVNADAEPDRPVRVDPGVMP